MDVAHFRTLAYFQVVSPENNKFQETTQVVELRGWDRTLEVLKAAFSAPCVLSLIQPFITSIIIGYTCSGFIGSGYVGFPVTRLCSAWALPSLHSWPPKVEATFRNVGWLG